MSLIKIARNTLTGKLVHIDNVPNGKACGCICIECGSALMATHGEVKRHHFRHVVEGNCEGALETALHEFAKQINN